MRPTTFALLGCAHPHSRWHLATLRLLPEVERIWLWDSDPEVARALAPEAGEKGAGVADDLDALLAREDVEFVLVARRNRETPDTVMRAARAGKHILSEKPMATDPAALVPALAAVREAGVTLGVCYQWRANPIARDLRRLRADGIFGRPLSVEARMITSQVRFRDPSHWLFRRAEAGGGILAWLGCHFLDLLRFVLDDEVVEVCALAETLSGDDIEVEDAASLALRFAGGAIGTFHAGYLLPRSRAGYQGATYDTHLSVRGTEGRFSWEPIAPEPVARLESIAPHWVGAPQREIRYTMEPCEAYGGRFGLELVREFIQAARAGVTPPTTGEDALRVLQIVAAAYESAATGRRVRVAT